MQSADIPNLSEITTGYIKTRQRQRQQFAANGPRVWNSLPASIRDPSLSLTVFRNSLKTHLFVQ